MTPRHDAQLFSSRFGDLMDGMGSTMFTIPVANLTMEECNGSATGVQRECNGSATCGMLTRFDKMLTLTNIDEVCQTWKGKAKTFKLLSKRGVQARCVTCSDRSIRHWQMMQ